jgi:putative ABC transport system substrate-binding protein
MSLATPRLSHAQQTKRRRIGVLMDLPPGDAEGQARLASFIAGLEALGWSSDRNMQWDIRWGANNTAQLRKQAAELAESKPDVIMSSGTASLAALAPMTDSIPIVFTIVADPVGAGFVSNLARPERNVTGFTPFEYGQTGKLLEFLQELTPRTKRVGVVRDPGLVTAIAQFAAIQTTGLSRRVEVSAVNARSAVEIEQSLAAFAQSSDAGLIVTASPTTTLHRKLISALAARHNLPAIYPQRFYVSAGGLASYGPDFLDQLRKAAGYVDRILKGAKPSDLPVQTPTKYELVINLKAAKALSIDIPAALLVRADEVIE